VKRWQFVLLMTIGVTCLCLGLVSIVFSHKNRKLQEALQTQQAIINKGTLSSQIGANLLREMVTVAQTDEKMRQLLQTSGYNPSATPGAAASPQ
jgi:Na+-translocating ferredoxin:NAD+ oxidoreductase RnfG subunit